MARQLQRLACLAHTRERGTLRLQGPQVIIEVVRHLEIGAVGTERRALRQAPRFDLTHVRRLCTVNGEHSQVTLVIVPDILGSGTAIDEHGYG